ncbi:hypothetical protein [Micromonospora endolithica]|uniref:Uncharacterized protein n=1 Tax=Micromonospora endolithica TaxID=230091 RepID=A0A3A9YR60_9ACTN|nr:hypothetical protein [Micromonospora endolithica]RKN38435.1 hypothetical protein D7223_31000 [Micromonospora endolithica]TWJ23146.1 hypothetical protein JD76_03275 [Micromonospora endolithica]
MTGRNAAPGAVFRWEDPPPPSYGGPGSPIAAHLRRVAAELRARPGQWAAIVEGPTGPPLTARIKRGTDHAWQPAGAFEAVYRTVAGETVTYARYVGPPS